VVRGTHIKSSELSNISLYLIYPITMVL